ncbi:unnamed protein product [Urochloa humidicola]
MTSCSRSRADPCAASAATSRVASASSRPFLEQLQDDLRLADALGAIRDLLRTVHGGNKIYQLEMHVEGMLEEVTCMGCCRN